MQSQLEKAINLAKKTGDRVIMFDSARSEEAFVVMSLDEYEKLAAGRKEARVLTDAELLDKINRDIAVWKNEAEIRESRAENENISKKDEEKDEYDQYIKEMYEKDFSSPGLRQMREELNEQEFPSAKKHWSIPRDRKKAAEEVVDDEDRQYLEEITF